MVVVDVDEDVDGVGFEVGLFEVEVDVVGEMGKMEIEG